MRLFKTKNVFLKDRNVQNTDISSKCLKFRPVLSILMKVYFYCIFESTRCKIACMQTPARVIKTVSCALKQANWHHYYVWVYIYWIISALLKLVSTVRKYVCIINISKRCWIYELFIFVHTITAYYSAVAHYNR